MKYTVGRYVIVPPKPFPSMEGAVQYIQKIYPELDKNTIEKHLTPTVKEDGNNKPGNSTKEDPAGQKTNTENSTEVSSGVKVGKDKSRELTKG